MRFADSASYILIVEDCPEQRQLLRHILEKNHHRVEACESGAQALAVMDKEKPGLVISDVSMPGMDGFELCRAIKAQDGSIPLILLTAKWEVEHLLDGLQAGADYYLLKPMDKKGLLKRVRDILNETPAQDETFEDSCLVYHFDGRDHSIPHSRRQILKLLISNHEMTVQEKAKQLAAPWS